jgi:hypothetical protein
MWGFLLSGFHFDMGDSNSGKKRGAHQGLSIYSNCSDEYDDVALCRFLDQWKSS